MPEPRNLGLIDSRGKALRHKYLSQEASPRGLLFQLPGDHYGVDGPLLYFPGRMLYSVGWDTFSLSYGYQSAGESFSPSHIPAIVDECSAAIGALLQQRSYPKLVLTGKSLGAAVVAVLLTMEMELDYARAIYLTPPLGTPVFDQVFIETKNASYIALGLADRFYNEQTLNQLQAKKEFRCTLVPGADHSLYIEGDLSATLQAHERVARAAFEFAQG